MALRGLKAPNGLMRASKIAKSLNCFEGLVALPPSRNKRSSGTVQHIVINREEEDD